MARNNPPAPTIVAAAIRITVNVLTNAVVSQTKFDYICTNDLTPPPVADLISARAAWVTACQTQFLACLSPLSTIISITTAELLFGTTPTDVLLYGTPPPGTEGTTNLALEMAAVTILRSTLKGQHGRGRFSMPAVPTTFTTPGTDANKLNAAALVAYNALNTALGPPLTGGARSWAYSILTRPTPPAVLISRGISVNSIITNPLLGTVRRRKPGRGI